MNQIVQWSFQHPFLAAFVAYPVFSVTYYLIFNILQIIDNVLMRFQWWMIAGRLRDKDGNITRENIESFERLVDKIDKKNEAENTTDE